MKIGIIGAGQLARMLLEDASALGIDGVVLAESMDDSAAMSAHSVVLGSPGDAAALEELAAKVDVITFDHELVDLELLAGLEERGIRIAPPTSAILFAVDKAAMRSALSAAGLPVPRFAIIAPGTTIDVAALERTFGWPLVVKAARGGYDGRGVFVVSSPDEANDVISDLHEMGITALIEELIDIEDELAALVCRSDSGDIVAWPVVETAQIDGVCREVLVPGGIGDQVRADGEKLALRIADLVGVVGVMAVELFVTKDGLVINELAMRPHNSGHWTQDGSVTSQFENHLRSVIGLPLGATSLTGSAIASVNVFGGEASLDPLESLAEALSVEDAHVHLYGKTPRPGRKLGHVTVVGGDAGLVRRQAWRSAMALGTPLPHALEKGAR